LHIAKIEILAVFTSAEAKNYLESWLIYYPTLKNFSIFNDILRFHHLFFNEI